jgi:phosphomevalonate kinase
MPRTSFAMAIKDYTFIRPGIAVSISALCLIAALVVGVVLISSLQQAARTVDSARRTAFTLSSYNAALQTWQELVASEDPQLKRPESRAMRDNIRKALLQQLQETRAAATDTSYQRLLDQVIKGLGATDAGMDAAGREAMVVVMARQDQAMLQAVAQSQRAVQLSAVLIALTVLAAGTLVVPMAWLYIRYKRGTLTQPAVMQAKA